MNKFNKLYKIVVEELSPVIRRFPSKDEFQAYLIEKYGAETAQKLYELLDSNDGVPIHTFWLYTPEHGYTFSEKHADYVVNNIWNNEKFK